jgi:hypothetical protein
MLMRALIVAHRYVGITAGVLMLIWCLSGIVMIYVPYPELSATVRLQHLPLIDWRGCCVSWAVPADDAGVSDFAIEMLGARPVLRVRAQGTTLVDLSNGQVLPQLSATEAQTVAAAFDPAAGQSHRPQLKGLLVEGDQWTVSGQYSAARPLYLFSLADPEGTALYVSAVTGEVVQVTTSSQRFWSWLGAIPHWLYFTWLRRDARLWSQIVIWTSLTGCVLTLLGLYIGLAALLRSRDGRWPPYRGVLIWHHLAGLVFGLFLLSWAASGLLSMNPWGFLDSDSASAVKELAGTPIKGAQVKAAVGALRALPGIVAVSAAPLAGRLYLTVTRQDGSRSRLDAVGHAAPPGDADWAQIAQRLGLRPPERLASGDAYFNAPGPVYRMVSDDAERTRYYFDPATASLLASFDSNGRWYRWLFQGVHTLDFAPVLRAHPLRDVLLMLLLTGAAATAATGTYMGWRRLVRRPARPRPGEDRP